MKKAMSVLLILSLTVSVIAAARSLTALAAPGDAGALSAKVKLYAGRYNIITKAFTPLVAGEKIKKGQEIAIRIAPQTNYLSGASRYVVMFDKTLFTLVGSTGDKAFTENTDKNRIDDDNLNMLAGYSGNYYYDVACTGFAGTINDSIDWPANFSPTDKEIFQAVAVETRTSGNALNGGYPEVLPGNWLFQFRLKAKQPIDDAGSTPHIWMDESWFESNTNPSAAGSIPKCMNGDLSSDAKSTYDFDYDFSGTSIRLPLTVNQEIPTAAPITTTEKTTTTATATTTEQTTSTTQSTIFRTTTTTKPSDTTASTYPGETTTRDPLEPLPTIAVTEFVTDEDGSRVFVTDEFGSTVYLTTVIYETVEDTQLPTDEDGNVIENPDGLQEDNKTMKIVIIVLAAAAVLGGAAFAISFFNKKK